MRMWRDPFKTPKGLQRLAAMRGVGLGGVSGRGGGGTATAMPMLTTRQQAYSAAAAAGMNAGMPGMTLGGMPGGFTGGIFGPITYAGPTQDYYTIDLPAQVRVVAPSGGDYTDPKAAIEACDAGDIVWIMGGTYSVSASIVVPADNITIQGTNPEAAVITNSAAGAVHALNLNGHDGVVVRDIGFVAAGGNTGYSIYGAATVDDTLIEHCWFDCTAGGNYAVYLDGGSRNTVQNCYLTSVQAYSFARMKGHYAVCRQNHIIQDYDGVCIAITILASDYCVVADNYIHELGTGSTGAIIVYISNNGRIVGNAIEVDDPAAAAYMISLRNHIAPSTKGGLISDNIVQLAGNVGGGIKLSTNDPQTLDWVTVNDNSVYDGSIGVRIDDARCNQTRVHDNNVTDCTTPVSNAGTDTNAVDNT